MDLFRQIIGIYIRLERRELSRLESNPSILPKYDPRVALSDGRGLDLGRAWEDLGVLLDGGVALPDGGPVVGDVPLPDTDSRAAWSYVQPERVAEIAGSLQEMDRSSFDGCYQVDSAETAEFPAASTGAWPDRGQYIFSKLRALAEHYEQAAEMGQGMLVRIGDRV